MEKRKKNQKNPFVGKWTVEKQYYNDNALGWILYRIYGYKYFVWEFAETKKIDLPYGGVMCEGTLLETGKEMKPCLTTYMYYPCEGKLYIDRSSFLDDGFMDICENDIYRVEKVNKKDLFLYDLENVEREPQDYLFRTKIRKLTEEELQFMKASASESPTLPRILISE